VAVKTGTTDDKRDNWIVGYTPSIVAGVWVGNNDNSPMDAKLASGITGAAPIWNRIMREILKERKDEPFIKPENIVSLRIDAYGGGLPYEGKEERDEYFIKGTEPVSISPIYRKIKLSKADKGKLANEVEVASGAYEEKTFIVFSENDPTAKDGRNRWQEGIDQWIEKQTDPIFHPPTQTSNVNENLVVVRIKKPADMSRTENENINILAEAKAIRGIKKMELYLDDNLERSVENNYLDIDVNLPVGRHKIKVKAYDSENHSGEAEVTIGVKTSAEEPTPFPTVTPFTISPSPTLMPLLSPT